MTRPDHPGFGLYIHVPFCKSKCPYCDFYSLPSLKSAKAYTDAILREIKTFERSRLLVSETDIQKTVTSIYFGGGTPSQLGSESIGRMLSGIKERFTVVKDAEITVECNPSDKNMPEFFANVKNAGVNRISLGMQSGVDIERRALGRTADVNRVREVVNEAKRTGIENISVDLMLGIPYQTLDTLKQSLDFALNMPITHLSVYILKIEEGTFFDKKRDSLPLPDEDTVADMYLFVCEYLTNHGWRHYEISNFCLNDRVAEHNTLYWQLGEYWGIGPGAHSYLGGKRFYFERDLQGFLAGNAPVFDALGGDAEEALMLALRLDTGIHLDEWCKKYGLTMNESAESFIKQCVQQNLATCQNQILILTDRGMLLSNAVIVNLVERLGNGADSR